MIFLQNKRDVINKKKLLREQNHLTRPPRLEGVVTEKMMQPVRKKEKAKPKGTE